MKKSPFAALTAILAALLASGLLVAGTAGPALAHDSLKSSSPAKGAEVESLDEVRLEFTARVRMPFVVLRGPDGAQYQAGEPEQEGAVVRQAVKSPLPGGKYTLAYRVVSSDGHPIEGEIPFTVKAPAEETPTASAEPSSPAAQPAAPVPSEAAPASSAATDPSATPAAAEDGGPSFPVWLIIVIGALVGIGIGFLFSARKSKP
ncbi:Copper resistance protein C precursor [Nonomuraea coxensis DSM 45129]|uniref:Copper resistance protein C n=1 Tax=Nonomuraea coxensis DSM 45129 TaxID=1122611 RepID=A0ABX8U113_9ACTN|nr:copper resistance CopC family protein [Nonomuraea coxensis]QYC40439.1 Copper resistance protein C precursor [Nonomuraea coxensis DSM 45129]